MTVSAGTTTDFHMIEMRTEQEWDVSHYLALYYATVGYSVTKLPDIDHPQTGYQRQYFYFMIGMGNLIEAEDGVKALRTQHVFRDGDGNNVMYCEIGFTNDATNDEFDIALKAYSYINTTESNDTCSIPRTTKYLFLRISLDYGDAAPDYLTMNAGVSLLPYWPTGTPNVFHTAQAINPGDLEVKRCLVQKFMSDVDPGCIMSCSPPLITPISRDASDANLVDYDFPWDWDNQGTLYYFGDDVPSGRRHLGPYAEPPYSEFAHQHLDGMRMHNTYLSTAVGDPDDEELETGNLIQRIKYTVAKIKKMITSDTGITWIDDILNIVGTGSGITWITNIGTLIGNLEDLIEDLITSPKNWIRKIIGSAVTGIVTDNPLNIDLLAELVMYLFEKIVASPIKNHFNPTMIFDIDGA